MPIDLVLFDLDETLLATESLRDARHGRHPVDLTTVAGFDSLRLHHGIAESLDALSLLTRIGLVSSSPRWYVTQLLSAYLSDHVFEVQITYDDVENIKPHPEPLRLALERADVTAGRALYVGDADLDYEACTAMGLAFVGAGWADLPTYPSAAGWARTPSDLVDLVGARS